MSSKPVCASCIHFSIDKIIRSTERKKPTWLHEIDYVREFISTQQRFTPYTPAYADMKVSVSLPAKYAGRAVLFWGSKKPRNALKPQNARTAYGHFKNSGVAIVNQDGQVELQVRCPQVYRVQQNHHTAPRSFFKHVHFVVSNAKHTRWNRQLYTKIVVCNLSVSAALKQHAAKRILFINTLSPKFYQRQHIPNTVNLSTETMSTMSFQALSQWIRDQAKKSCPPIHRALVQNALFPSEVPIVLYCASTRCHSSTKAAHRLLQKGFSNVSIMGGGIEAYLETV